VASHATDSRIRRLAKNAHDRFISQDSREQARLLKILLSNSVFDCGSLSVSCGIPFDPLVEGNETGIGWVSGTISATGW
jgi:hypothetical protein